MADDTRRPESVEALARALQKQSVESVLFNQLVADRVGINLTDLKCMSLLQLEGTLTAGRLGELAGLTGGAVTGVVDRLEKARLVERVPDPEDRRRLTVSLTARGQAAARAIRSAVDQVDAGLAARVGAEFVLHTRTTLAALREIGEEAGP